MFKRGIKLYIDDIKNSIADIEEFTKDLTFEEFENDQKTINAVIRSLTIIGEAANNLPEETKTKYSDIPWRDIIGMRNKVIHEYFGIKENILWKTIEEDLPVLKKQISELLEE